MTKRWQTLAAICGVLFMILGLVLLGSPEGASAQGGAVSLAAAQTPTPAMVEKWVGQVVGNVTNATRGGGSIVRVRVYDRPGENIVLTRNGDLTLSGYSGTKPEYGIDMAEFAPVPAGHWKVSLPGLNASTEIDTDGYNMIVLEFSPQTITASSDPAPIMPLAIPQSIESWSGRVVSVTEGPMWSGALLQVRVKGLPGQAVNISTAKSLISTGFTGTKLELGDDIVEFAPLTTGRYTITPVGLNTSLTVDLVWHTTVLVEFSPVTSAPTAANETGSTLPTSTATLTPTPALPTSTATPLPTPLASPAVIPLPTEAPIPTSTPTLIPLPSPTATSTPPAVSSGTGNWVGSIIRQDDPSSRTTDGSIVVRVNNVEGVAVHLSSQTTNLTCITGTKEDYGDYACEFTGLKLGVYTITAEGIPPSVVVAMNRGGFALVEFRQDTSQSPSEAWQGQVLRNSSGSQPASGVSSAIVVHVYGLVGQTVVLRSSGDYRATCKTGTKPEYGAYACEFGGLWPAVYTIAPEGIDAEVSTYMDGVGFAEISFEPTIPTPTPTVISPTATIALTPVMTTTAVATEVPIVAGSIPSEPAIGWSGQVVREETVNGNSSITVRAVGLNQQPIILRSGGWSSRAVTGSKPEYGQDTVEFGALSAGDYTIELEGLNTVLPVHLPEKGRLEVEFSFGPLPTPTPAPVVKPGEWTGAITSNSSGSFPRGVWSTIIVKVPGTDKMPVKFDSGGFVTSCLTNTKPEFGAGACQIGGLWPGTYKVTPQGLGPSVDVWVDGAGSAVVEFWKQ